MVFLNEVDIITVFVGEGGNSGRGLVVGRRGVSGQAHVPVEALKSLHRLSVQS